MIVSRIIAPASKLATAKALDPVTAASSLGVELGLGEVREDELYAALDWLLERQGAIETALAKRHLKGGTLVLYDVSSSYVEGRCCPLAKRGYNRDGKKGKLQIVYGLLCAPDGCPVAIEVFEGNTGDPTTLADQVAKLKRRFAIDHVVLVGDRGMITQARIDEDLRPAGLDWITALRAPALQGLVGGGHLQMSLFDERDMAAITSPDFPGERLIVCRNPDLARERARKREDLLAATERDLAKIAASVARKTPAPARRGRDRHGRRRRARQAQDGQALRPDDRRRPVRLRPKARADRAGGRARRPLRRAHQPARSRPSPTTPRSRPTNPCPWWNAPFDA